MASTLERLELFVDRSNGPDGCWPWTGCYRRDGYGWIRDGEGRNSSAHRMAYALWVGPIPPDRPFVLHSCDNRKCCNPKHLRVGTREDNTNDAVVRDRVMHGAAHVNARLDDARVRQIRERLAAGEVQTALAAEYGVTQSVISRIKTGKIWRRQMTPSTTPTQED